MNAKLYEKSLNGLKNVFFEKYNINNSYFIFQIFVDRDKRDQIVKKFQKLNIGCLYYAKPINEYKFYKKDKTKKFDNAKFYADSNIFTNSFIFKAMEIELVL